MCDKDGLRNKLKIKRKFFQGVQREFADYAIAQNFLSAYGHYDSFFIYNSFSSEADTHYIISRLIEEGKKVYLPRIEGEDMVAVPYGETVKNKSGIEEPKGHAYTGKIDVCVIPLLAVNERGYRIGYGKGFYDKFLKKNETLKIGLGYFFQIEEFEEDAWDERLNGFVSEKGIYSYE